MIRAFLHRPRTDFRFHVSTLLFSGMSLISSSPPRVHYRAALHQWSISSSSGSRWWKYLNSLQQIFHSLMTRVNRETRTKCKRQQTKQWKILSAVGVCQHRKTVLDDVNWNLNLLLTHSSSVLSCENRDKRQSRIVWKVFHHNFLAQKDHWAWSRFLSTRVVPRAMLCGAQSTLSLEVAWKTSKWRTQRRICCKISTTMMSFERRVMWMWDTFFIRGFCFRCVLYSQRLQSSLLFHFSSPFVAKNTRSARCSAKR